MVALFFLNIYLRLAVGGANQIRVIALLMHLGEQHLFLLRPFVVLKTRSAMRAHGGNVEHLICVGNWLGSAKGSAPPSPFVEWQASTCKSLLVLVFFQHPDSL